MSIIIGAAVFVVGVCVGGVIMGLLAAGGRDERRIEVRDAFKKLALRLEFMYEVLDDWEWDMDVRERDDMFGTLAECRSYFVAVVDLLGISRSVLDSWTSDTANAPVASTGDGGTTDGAPATALHENGTVGVAAGNYVSQSIASR